MLSKIIDVSVRHRWVVLALALLACFGGWQAMRNLPLDATPDLSEKQVIILSRWDRSPDIVEDQVTYPIVTAMLGAPHVKNVRGISDFGYSYVYVTFDDTTDLYWARSRTSEYLSGVVPRLPEGVKPQLGPDATALGWVYQYALVDTSGRRSLAELRSLQDWYLRYYLQSVPGVAEIALIGGYERQYQITVDPNLLRARAISLSHVVEAVRRANQESSGRVLEFADTEYVVRSRGYAHSLEDFANIPLGVSESGSQLRLKDIGRVGLGPDLRRGVADLDGRGETVSGIVIMRNGMNALDVVRRVKRRLDEIAPDLPSGVKVVPVYDRSELIQNTIGTVKDTILQIAVTVALTVAIFLWHFPSAVIPILTTPVAVLLTFLGCRVLGIEANVMSLAGVALAFSELSDASIVVVEQTHKRLEVWDKQERPGRCSDVVLDAVKEVSIPAFFALLVIAVSFLPVILLPGEEGRMFQPLAYTKTLTLIVAAVLAVTLDPALRLLVTRAEPFRFRPGWLCACLNRLLVSRIHSEEQHPATRLLMRAYEPVVRRILKWKWEVVAIAMTLVLVSVPVFLRLGTESIPPLDEGSILYMPSTLPGVSVTEAEHLLRITDRIIRSFPQVDHVLGKAGRAETATDPAPLSMLETVIVLKPRETWPRIGTWYSSWAPDWLKPLLRRVTSDTISTQELIAQMNAALRIPGINNAWTMPIRGRIDMLNSGLRTPLGLKITGADIEKVQQIGVQVESLLRSVPGTRTVLAERLAEGHFIDVDWDREQLARYGIDIADAQSAVENAIGGENVTTVLLGRERYPVNVRYQRDFRSDLDALRHLPVTTSGHQIPMGDLADIHVRSGPAMIRDEEGLLTGYIYLDIAGRDLETYIRDANSVFRNRLNLPRNYTLAWSGQYEAMQQVRDRLRLVVPITVCLVCLLLYINTRSIAKTSIILLALPFSAVGAVWFLYLAGYNISAAVWVGLIALLGIDAETGVFMLLYLDLAYKDAVSRGRMRSTSELQEAVIQGAAKRVRPKFMTFACTCAGLLPVLWATGAGADVMKRIAAPMVGGIFTSFILELLVYPAIYQLWRERPFLQNRSSSFDLIRPEHALAGGD